MDTCRDQQVEKALRQECLRNSVEASVDSRRANNGKGRGGAGAGEQIVRALESAVRTSASLLGEQGKALHRK